MLAELKIKYAGTSGKFTQPRIAISKSDGPPIHSPTYLVHAALVARPAAALALDVLLHEADAARSATHEAPSISQTLKADGGRTINPLSYLGHSAERGGAKHAPPCLFEITSCGG